MRGGRLVLGVIAVAVVVGGWWWTSSIRRQRQDETNRARLKRLALALHDYNDKHGSFPPAYFADKDGKPFVSWRVLVLPFLDEAELFQKYDMSQPWDAAGNLQVAAAMPTVFASPFGGDTGTTPYQALVGSQTMWPGPVACKLNDIKDGTSNTTMLVESPILVPWTKPADVAFVDWLGPTDGEPLVRRVSNGRYTFCTAMGDGSARTAPIGVDRRLLRAYGTANLGRSHPGLHGKPLPGEGDFGGFPADLVDRELPTTDLEPSLAIPLRPGRNAVWCATSALAWADLRRAGYPLDGLRMNDTIRQLERDVFPPSDLAAESYFVKTSRDAKDELSAALRQRFPGAGFRPTPLAPQFQGWQAIAYLEKSLPFAVAFQTPTTPLEFAWEGGKARAKCFGISDEPLSPGANHEIWLNQVWFKHYAGPRDAVAALRTTRGDQVLLAQLPPAATLGETWTAVAARIAAAKGESAMLEGETILVPKLRFATTKAFGQFQPDRPDPARLLSFSQSIRFMLDEAGAKLESGNETIDGEQNGHGHELGPKHLRFDRPFLLALIEAKATKPYLLVWIGDADLLEKAAD